MATQQYQAPSHTLYVTGVNDKIKLENLKKSLYLFFGQCGEVIEVIVRPGQKWRGQAWIVFKTQQDATRAKSVLNGYLFYGRILDIQYSKNKSDIIAKAEGVYNSKQLLKNLDGKLSTLQSNMLGGVGDEGGKKRGLEDATGEEAKRQKLNAAQQQLNAFPYKLIENPQADPTLIKDATILYATNFPPQATLDMMNTFFNQPQSIRPLTEKQNDDILAEIDTSFINEDATGYLVTFATNAALQKALELQGMKWGDDYKLKLYYVYDTTPKVDPQAPVALAAADATPTAAVDEEKKIKEENSTTTTTTTTEEASSSSSTTTAAEVKTEMSDETPAAPTPAAPSTTEADVKTEPAQ